MTVEVFQEPGGIYAVDWEMVRSIFRSYANQKAIVNNLTTTKTSTSKFYNPLSWSMPDIVQTEVNWKNVYRDRDAIVKQLMAKAHGQFNSCLVLKNWLITLVNETEGFRQKFRTASNTAMKQTMDNIARSEQSYTGKVKTAKFFRDRAGDVLIVGGIVMSGGAGLGVVTLGGVWKGAAKYQDTGNVGQASFEAASNIVLSVIPLAQVGNAARLAVAPFAERAAISGAMVLISGQLNFAGAVIGGRSPREALVETVVKETLGLATGGILNRLVTKPFVSKMLGNAVIPVTGKIKALGTRTDLATGLAGKGMSSTIIDPTAAAAADRFKPKGNNTGKPKFPSKLTNINTQKCTITEQMMAIPAIVEQAVKQIGSGP